MSKTQCASRTNLRELFNNGKTSKHPHIFIIEFYVIFKNISQIRGACIIYSMIHKDRGFVDFCDMSMKMMQSLNLENR